MPMKVMHFRDTDTLYIELKAADIVQTRDLDEDTHLDVDRDGNICAITIERAKDRTDIHHFTYEQVGVEG